MVWSCFAWLVLGLGLFRICLWEPMKVNGNSMAPTLTHEQTVVVNKHAFGFQLPPLPWRIARSHPRLGDVVVFQAPAGERWIKRVAAQPGDDIVYIPKLGWFRGQYFISPDIERSVDMIDPPEWMEAYRPTSIQLGLHRGWVVRIPSNRYFLLGDNASQSLDSRSIGPVSEFKFSGRVD